VVDRVPVLAPWSGERTLADVVDGTARHVDRHRTDITVQDDAFLVRAMDVGAGDVACVGVVVVDADVATGRVEVTRHVPADLLCILSLPSSPRREHRVVLGLLGGDRGAP
jgi:hypothetical protein